ncbi:MAG: hypothetical protein QN122_12070 [Armatimonadota bacterium]|nr:hypothetical protein [Armatimonadota bacterium]
MTGRKLTICLGLVRVPVRHAPLIPSKAGRRAARICCRQHLAPVTTEYRCTAGGELAEERVLAYEVEGGRYVEVEREALGLDASGGRELHLAAAVVGLDPALVERTYLVWPEQGHEQAYALLARMLEATGRWLVGVAVVDRASRLMALRWSPTLAVPVLHACVYEERLAWTQVRAARAALEEVGDLPEALLRQARLLVRHLPGEVDLSAVRDEYAAELEAAIAAAAAGEPREPPPSPEEAATADLLAALRASVRDARKGRGART